MTNFIRMIIVILVLSTHAEAREMRCGGDTYPGYPADASSAGHIYCLKSCGSKQGYLYLVQDKQNQFGKENDRARFKLVRSKFVATTRGPYGNQRILHKDGDVQCLAASRLSEAIPLVSIIADFGASNREKEKVMVKIGKIGVQVADEANVVLEQVRTAIANADCGEDETVAFATVSDIFTGGVVENKEIAVASQSDVTTLAFARNIDGGKKEEIFQCQAIKNAKIVNQMANNLMLYKTNSTDATRSAASEEEANK